MVDPERAAVLLALTTVPDAAVAERLSLVLVEEGHAACVSALSGVTSFYRWAGETHREAEHLLLVKTTQQAFPALRERIVEMHPYDVPEVVAFPVTDGHAPYLEWVRGEVERP
jgi:periplasmic divalent cation tolerance protein